MSSDCDEIVYSFVDQPNIVVDGADYEIQVSSEPVQLVSGGSDVDEIVFVSGGLTQLVSSDTVSEIVFGALANVELVVSCERGPAGPPGSGGGGSGLVYQVQDGPDYQASYVYVGYKETGGAWYIYRRTYAGNIRMYASGNTNYTTNWTNRTGLVYS